mgnify:CR=1 FL=1
MFIIRIIIPLIIIGCSSIDEKSYGRISFDSSFSAEQRFSLGSCLSDLKEELYLSNLRIDTTSENINSLGLEFNSKTVLSANFNNFVSDEIFAFKIEEVSETNFISSNMALAQSNEVQQVMLFKLCDHIESKFSDD